MDYIEKTPILSGRQNEQFAIPFKKKEVVPPTKQGVEKVLATALGKVKILARLMRETGRALVDAQKVNIMTLRSSDCRSRNAAGQRRAACPSRH